MFREVRDLESQRKCEGHKTIWIVPQMKTIHQVKTPKWRPRCFVLPIVSSREKIKTNLESLKCFIWCRYLWWFSFVLISSSDKSGRFWDNPQTEQVEDLSQVSNSETVEWVGPKCSGTMGEGWGLTPVEPIRFIGSSSSGNSFLSKSLWKVPNNMSAFPNNVSHCVD